MEISSLLDVALSLVFIFFVFSLFVSGTVEFLNSLVEKLAELLKESLGKLVSASQLAAFYDHPLVHVKSGKKPISYLSGRSFSTVVLDLLAKETGASALGSYAFFQELRKAAQTAVPAAGSLLAFVQPFLREASGFEDFERRLETWYDGYMEQVSGWFKQYAQRIVRIVAVVITLFFNLDTIHLTQRLLNDDTLRARLVSEAERVAARSDAALGQDASFRSYLAGRLPDVVTADGAIRTDLTAMQQVQVRATYLQYLKDNVEGFSLPVGWKFRPGSSFGDGCSQVLHAFASWSLLGWVLTATALSFGAPFWFDLLVRLVNIRNVGNKP